MYMYGYPVCIFYFLMVTNLLTVMIMFKNKHKKYLKHAKRNQQCISCHLHVHVNYVMIAKPHTQSSQLE